MDNSFPLQFNDREKQLNDTILSVLPERYHEKWLSALNYVYPFVKEEKRYNGDTLLQHLLTVSLYVLDYGIDFNSILAALLHQAIRDFPKGEYSEQRVREDILRLFGEDVYGLNNILEGLSGVSVGDSEADGLTRFLLKRSEDMRVILIRLADKMANIKTLDGLPEERKARMARKSLNIYSPLAEYLNLKQYKEDFDEIGFKVLYPEEHQRIQQYVKDLGLDDKVLVNRIQSYFESGLSQITDKKVFGRRKSNYSIYKKLKKRSNEGDLGSLANFHDLLAYTIVVPTVEDCYKVASLLQNSISSETLEFEDYIMNPKPNGFKEIQIVISIPKIAPTYIEVQILTPEMYYHNTYGEASHFAYKKALTRFVAPSNEYRWVEEVRKKITESKVLSPEDLPESNPIRSTLFVDHVFVLTPKNELIELPTGATAIDFAFAIHNQIGSKMISCKINGVDQPVETEIVTGDRVEIIMATNTQQKTTVKEDWLSKVKTRRARFEIEKALRR